VNRRFPIALKRSASLSLVAMLTMLYANPGLAADAPPTIANLPDGLETPLLASAPPSNFESLFAATGIAEPVEKPVSPLNCLQKASLNASNRDILKILVSMQRLNTVFRMASTKQPKWRQARQTTYVETNSLCTLYGTIDAMRLQYANIDKPALDYTIKNTREANGSILRTVTTKVDDLHKVRAALNQSVQEPQVAGNCVNLCGDVFELGVNAVRWRQLRSQGLDSRSYRKRMIVLQDELKSAFDKRLLLHREFPEGSQERVLSGDEFRLQEDLRNLLLREFSQYHSSSSKLHWFQNAAYMLDFAKNSTGAIGGIVSIEGGHLDRARWGGGASIFTTISGTLTLMIPFAGRVAGNWASTVDRHIVSKDFGKVLAESTRDITEDQAKLAQAMKQLPPDAPETRDTSLRAFGYGEIATNMRDHEENLKRLVQRGRKVTIENFIYGGIIGSTKVSLGVCGILAGYRYYNSPWLASRLQAAGNTSYTAGTTFSAFENMRVVTMQHFSNNRLREQRLLPSQLYTQRLGRLDVVDDKLKSAAVSPSAPSI
jgi:hypothetical protein